MPCKLCGFPTKKGSVSLCNFCAQTTFLCKGCDKLVPNSGGRGDYCTDCIQHSAGFCVACSSLIKNQQDVQMVFPPRRGSSPLRVCQSCADNMAPLAALDKEQINIKTHAWPSGDPVARLTNIKLQLSMPELDILTCAGLPMPSPTEEKAINSLKAHLLPSSRQHFIHIFPPPPHDFLIKAGLPTEISLAVFSPSAHKLIPTLRLGDGWIWSLGAIQSGGTYITFNEPGAVVNGWPASLVNTLPGLQRKAAIAMLPLLNRVPKGQLETWLTWDITPHLVRVLAKSERSSTSGAGGSTMFFRAANDPYPR